MSEKEAGKDGKVLDWIARSDHDRVVQGGPFLYQDLTEDTA
jgi:hypothetical protein